MAFLEFTEDRPENFADLAHSGINSDGVEDGRHQVSRLVKRRLAHGRQRAA